MTRRLRRGALYQTRSGQRRPLVHSILSLTLFAQSPPPYSALPEGSSAKPQPRQNLPPDLAPTNYLHVKERDNSVKRKILLDLSVPRPPATSLAVAAEAQQDEDTPNLILDSHNGAVSGEVWLLNANREDAASHEDPKPKRERVHLHFRSHNGSVKALVVRAKKKKKNSRSVFPFFPDYFVRAASSSAYGRASPVPQHRSQGTQWRNLGHDSAILLRTADASYRQRQSAPRAYACTSRRIAVRIQRDSHILCW